MFPLRADEPGAGSHEETAYRFPTVRAEHRHARTLLANALRYFEPEHKIVDPISGYPFEGWNQDPERGLYLRSFTQLTAIGQYMELLANIAAGLCDTPFLSRDGAVERLKHVAKNLRQDQHDPTLSAGNLLGNFLDLAGGKRLGPLSSDVDRQQFLVAFGNERGDDIWKALQAKKWIVPRGKSDEADIHRSATFGWDHFDGPLAPFNEEMTKQKIMQLLDQRVVMVVFIDNANLSSSVAKTIGALLTPTIRDRPGIAQLREKLERFLEDQQAGYHELYDAKAGQFYFGRDATKNRHFGWLDLQGRWVTGHVDYLVNEFRGPATFIVTRFGLPLEAIKNLGFKMKPYTTREGQELFVLAPWEGSAFQALGLELSMTELKRPSWRRLLQNVVEVEIDYSTRKQLPGFLSESYSGQGVQYTGNIGIPDITVSPLPRITDAPSLYTAGTAYSVSPDKVEGFLAARWPQISKLMTEHGPWEGYQMSHGSIIEFQTTAHTLSLILGLLGTSSDHMNAYLESKKLDSTLDRLFDATEREVDLLASGTQVFAWNDKRVPMQSGRLQNGFQVRARQVIDAGIAFVPGNPQGVNLSGGLLTLRYRSSTEAPRVLIALKPVESRPGLIPTELFTRFERTGEKEKEIQIPLPSTPGLFKVKEVVITFGPDSQGRPLDLSISRMSCVPVRPDGVTAKVTGTRRSAP
jgi:hypothetical protein